MSYKRPPNSHDLSRNKINRNTCIQLKGIVILVVFIILLELHIRRLSIHPLLAIGLSLGMLMVCGFLATRSAK
jgi:uncharacterized membrane protein YjgN (DUF898 family)